MSVLYPITKTTYIRETKRTIFFTSFRLLFLLLITGISFTGSFAQETPPGKKTQTEAELKREAKSRRQEAIGVEKKPQLKALPDQNSQLIDELEEKRKNREQEARVRNAVVSEVYTSANGEIRYRISDAGRVITDQTAMVSDNVEISKVAGQKQADAVANAYRNCPTCTPEELLYRVSVDANPIYSDPAAAARTLAVCNYSGTVQTGDQQFNGLRILRDGIPNTCALSEPCPGSSTASIYNFDTYTIVNNTGSSQCVTVTTTSNTAGQLVHTTAYLGSFVSSNICTNYIADMGSSADGTAFSFNLANGATVVLVVYNPNAGTTTTAYTLTVDGLNCLVSSSFAITNQPANSTACNGTGTTFGVTATSPIGTSITYAWQEDRGTGFVYLANGGVYSGVGTPTLTLTTTNLTMNGWKYRCVLILSTGGLPLISNEATLTVRALPSSPSVSPAAATICRGGSVQLNVSPSQTFSGGAITIPDSGPGTPYPSTINVSGLPAGSTIKSVSLNGMNHTFPDDIDILLQSPGAAGNVILMSDVGGGTDLINHNYVFDDAAASTMSDIALNASGTYRPTNSGATDNFIAPGPGSFTQATPALSLFGAVTNGTWSLFVVDDAGGDLGSIASWSITFALPGGGTAIFSPAAGLFTDAGLTIPYTAGAAVATVYASPLTTTTYSAFINDGFCNSSPANISVTVNQPPAITTHPTGPLGCVGANKSFSVTATGTGLTYQWQEDQGGGFVNLVNNATYSGATTPNLTISNLTLAMSGYLYRCVVSGTCSPAANSNSITLTVNSLPVMTVGPNYQCSPVVLTATGANTYSWSPAAGLSATTGATVTANPTVNTTYTITGTNTTTTCSNTAQAIVNGTPSQPNVTPSAPVICLGTVQPFSTFSTATVTSSSGPITVNVPDASPTGVTHTLNVAGIPAGGVVSGISVNFNMTHTWDSDMIINLRAPNGNVLNLVNERGGSGDNFVNTTISSAAVTPVSAGTPPFTGTFLPDGVTGVGPTGQASNVANFSGLFSVGNGSWTLAMEDLFGGDLGILTSWSITITYGVGNPAAWTPVTGLFTDPAGTVPYVAGTQVTNIYASPTSTTTYTVTSSNTGPGGPGGDIVMNSTQVPITISSAAATNGLPYPSTITASLLNPGTTVKSVTLNGISHTWLSDVNVVLVSPTGVPVILMSETGDDDDISGSPRTYTFSDAAAGTLSATSPASPSGTYMPTNYFTPDVFPAPGPGSLTQPSPTLSSFTGNLNGVWSLYVRDYFAGDGGQIANWSITFNTPGGTVTCTSPPRTVTITVNNPIVFTTQPQNRTICQNDNVTFTVAATGTVQTYQWQVSTNGGGTWINLANVTGSVAGATTATLTLSNMQPVVTPAPNRQYRCLLGSVGCGNSTSAVATLIVNSLPTVSLAATGPLQLRPGMLTTLTASSSPAGTSYQWLVNGVPQPGITGSSYVADAYHLGTYTVRVTDVNGCVNTTNGITLSALASDNLFVYPNPTNGAYFVTFYLPQVGQPVTINVIDMKGRKLVTRQAVTTAPYTRFDFDAGNLAAGVYIIEFRDSGGDRLGTGKLVVNR